MAAAGPGIADLLDPDRDARLSSPAWASFTRLQSKQNSSHFQARCNCCDDQGKETLVNGTARDMDSHLYKCAQAAPAVREAARLRHVERQTARTSTSQKRAVPASPSEGSSAAKRPNQGTLHTVALRDKPLSAAQQTEFESKLLRATVSANWPLQTVENPEVLELFHFLRPNLELPSRWVLSNRVLTQGVSDVLPCQAV